MLVLLRSAQTETQKLTEFSSTFKVGKQRVGSLSLTAGDRLHLSELKRSEGTSLKARRQLAVMMLLLWRRRSHTPFASEYGMGQRADQAGDHLAPILGVSPDDFLIYSRPTQTWHRNCETLAICVLRGVGDSALVE